jgi:hypothetical protein
MGAMAHLGRILLQFIIPELTADFVILSRLRARPAGNSFIHGGIGTRSDSTSAAHGAG